VSTGPHGPGRPAPDDPEPNEEALRRLEERLDRASEAAERLIIEAAARVARAPGGDEVAQAPGGDQAAQAPGGDQAAQAPGDRPSPPRSEPEFEQPQAAAKPPPAGWQSRGEGPSDGSGAAAATASSRSELDVLLQILGALRDRIPPELQHRLGEALREVLLAIRALIDWYLERTERRRAESVQVEDIPIM
jgi:hypothetical protein